MSFHRLLALFERSRESCQPLVLCTVIRTAGSTYAKPGALMLIATDGEYAGLLSGGCLEGDLREHARRVAASGAAQIIRYDLRSSTDQLFGLGAGCEGAMDVLLTRVSAIEHWQPLARMAEDCRADRAGRIAWVISENNPTWPLGLVELNPPPDWRTGPWSQARPPVDWFGVRVSPPPRLLLAGGGPDARPVAQLASYLGWRVTVLEHRGHYVEPGRFPEDTVLIEIRPEDAGQRVELAGFAAAVVMSHHLESDLQYLRALARSSVPYVGLLGPAARREKLLADLGADAARLHGRLRAPVGLDLGGRSPESIALSIVGEIHAVLENRSARPFSSSAPP